MFRIVLHAMWSKDFMTPLLHALAGVMDDDLEAAKQVVQDMDQGLHPHLYIPELTVVTELMQNILQFGVFASVEQVEALREEVLVQELEELMLEELHGWLVQLNPDESHVRQIIHARTLASISFESQSMMDAVGERVLDRGGGLISSPVAERIEARIHAWRTVWRQRVAYYLERKRRERGG